MFSRLQFHLQTGAPRAAPYITNDCPRRKEETSWSPFSTVLMAVFPLWALLSSNRSLLHIQKLFPLRVHSDR